MSKPNEENLGLDWLEKMVERSKSEPVFEGTEWDRVLSEQGRITVFFEMLDKPTVAARDLRVPS
jgi:hypothetical protein